MKRHLAARGLAVDDVGTTDATTSVDYPHFAERVARAVVLGRASEGMLFCGTGVGIGIAANKVAGARAATVSEPASARLAREHNDANVLCLGSRIVGVELARDIVDAWLVARFAGGRHQRRIDEISELERQSAVAAASPAPANAARQP